MAKSVFEFCQGNGHILLCIQCRANCSKQMRIVRNDRMLLIQFQCSDKRFFQFRKEMQRSSQECHMTTDWFTTCQSRNRLIDYCLENRRRKILLCCTIVDQRLNICLCKHTTSCSNRIKSLVILRIFVQSRCICLKQRCHLINEGASTTGADTIHSLFNISALKINDLGILAAKFDRNIRLWCKLLQRS